MHTFTDIDVRANFAVVKTIEERINGGVITDLCKHVADVCK